MKRELLFEFRKKISVILLTIPGVYIAIRYAHACTEGIRSGIDFSIEVLVPSLFFFMVIASMIANSRAAYLLAVPLSPFVRRVLRLPAVCGAPLLLALIGGYPIGARAIETLSARGVIDDDTAEKTAMAAVCAGPGFVLNYVGAALLDSRRAGVLLLCASAIGYLITAVIIGRAIKSDPASARADIQSAPGNLLVSGVSDAARGTFSMCAMVVVFCAAAEVLRTILAGLPLLCDLLTALCEVTAGLNRLCGSVELWVIAFFIGFGGFSVHFQIFAILGERLKRRLLFVVFRLVNGISTALAAYTLLIFFPVSRAVFSTASQSGVPALSATVWGSSALVLAALCFLGSIQYSGGHYVRNRRLAGQPQGSDK